MKSNRGCGLVLDMGRESLVSSSGGLLLGQVARRSGLDRGLSAGLAQWCSGRVRHDPGKIVLDLAMAVGLGGDCLADIAAVRAQPDLFGEVASDPTVSRLIHRLAADADDAIAAIGRARRQARARIWSLRRPLPGEPGGGVIIDLDATLVTAHSDKEGAEPTYKRGFGFHPFFAFADHGPAGTGEVLAAMLRRGGAAANTAADHIELTGQAVAALPAAEQPSGQPSGQPGGRHRVLVRTDSAGGSKQFLGWLSDQGLEYSVGFPATTSVADALERVPRQAWRPRSTATGTPARAPRSPNSPTGSALTATTDPDPAANGRTGCG